MKKGEIRTIRVDGMPIQASYLGKGNYATCWRVGDTVYSFVNEEPEIGDFAKEALSNYAPEHPQIPRYITHQNASECASECAAESAAWSAAWSAARKWQLVTTLRAIKVLETKGVRP